jgi:hypothetical protein
MFFTKHFLQTKTIGVLKGILIRSNKRQIDKKFCCPSQNYRRKKTEEAKQGQRKCYLKVVTNEKGEAVGEVVTIIC